MAKLEKIGYGQLELNQVAFPSTGRIEAQCALGTGFSEEVPAENVEKEKEILVAQAQNEGKPKEIAEKMVQGRIKKYYKDVCLMEQEFVKDPSKTISDLITEATLKIGEKITIRRFVRYEMGEGLEKRQDNFAEEVMSQMGK